MDTLEQAVAAWGTFDRDAPFPLFAELRERGAVHPVTLADGHDAWLVVGATEARDALHDPRLSKDMQAALAADGAIVAEGLPGPAFARHMLAVDPPDHTRLRGLVSSTFSARRIEALRVRVQTIVDDLLDEIANEPPGEPVDLVAGLAFPMPFTVICELLGVPPEQRAPFGRALQDLVDLAGDPESYPQAQAASDAVVARLTRLVDTKQRDPGDDLVSGLIAARDGEDRLGRQELLSTILQLIIAGHDTTASLIGNGVVALLTHPDQLAMLRDDPELIDVALEELLRFDAPVHHTTFRYAREPVELGGVTIPAGAQVIVNLAAANRDPELNPDPDRLDLARDDLHHLSFGRGIHFCLGARLARLEGRIAIGTLVERFPDLRLAVPVEQLHWRHGDGLVLRGLSALPVVPGLARARSDRTSR